jgi:hypothetical protein
MLGSDSSLWSDRRKNVAIDEGGRTYRASNDGNNLLTCYRIDGGLITEGKRCDFALSVREAGKIYFIELKGTDISHAAEQIQSTIATFSAKLKKSIVFGRIVCSRVSHPRIRRPALVRLEQLVAQTTGDVRIASIEFAERI